MAALPIRVRLTLWYLALLSVVLLALGGGGYLIARAGLNESLDESLRDRGAVLLSSLTYDAAGRPSLIIDTTDRRLADSFQRLLDTDGRVIADNAGTFGPVPMVEADIRRALAGTPSLEDFPPPRPGDEPARLLTVPVRSGGTIAGALQVGESLEDLDETLDRLAIGLVLGIPLALLLAGTGGWFVAGRALAPVNDVTRAAREIAAGDLSRRLNLALPDDEIGRLARTFDEMIARIDATLQRQRRFTADASHELRTPLAAMRVQVEVALSKARSADDYRAALQAVDAEMSRLTRLVEAMLFAARSEADSLQLEKEPVAVAGLVESVREQAELLARDKPLAVRVVAGPTAVVLADEALVLQLLLNLVDNAVRYTERGEIRLGWRVAGSMVEIDVADTGPGIPLELQQKVFEPFFRADASRAHPGGAGLGLSICRWIAEAHGGSITLHSDARGSVFTVSLPG